VQYLAGADMEPRVVLRILDDVAVELAVDQRPLLMGAQTVGGAETAVLGIDDDMPVTGPERGLLSVANNSR